VPVRPTMKLSPTDAAVMLGGLQAVDETQMRRAGPFRPRVSDMIADGRLRYSRYDPEEHWQTYDEVVEEVGRWGSAEADCEDLGAMQAAEYRVDGVDPTAHTVVKRTGPAMSHVTVQGDWVGAVDPSRLAGMGWRE